MNYQDRPQDHLSRTEEAQCPQCGSVAVGLTSVRSALWQGERLVIIEGLPALECRTCREQFYDDVTATMLDLLRGAGFPEERADRFLKVPVFDYTQRLKRADPAEPEPPR